MTITDAHQLVGQQLLARCAELAAISSLPDAICRVYLSKEHKSANRLALQWMQEAGMTAYEDAAGNVRGRYAGATSTAPVLLIGSHLDTVPNAGAYDGILGVLLGISAVAELHAAGTRLPFAIEVIGFGEEEGVRFGTTLMCSRALAGNWDTDWWALQDADGVSLVEAFREFGLDPQKVADAQWGDEPLIGYFEPHIEQGPVLENLDLPLGVVSAIAGAKRARISIQGMAGHAGTVPMTLRKDALVAAAFGVQLLERVAIKHNVVATVGQISAKPGGVNVIPGRTEFSLDIRSGDDSLREVAFKAFQAELTGECDKRGLQLSVEVTHAASAAPCAPELCNVLGGALTDIGIDPHVLESGAGHDAMAVAPLCDITMLFIRCTGGISHNPAEAVLQDDVALAHGATLAFLKRMAATRT